MTEFINFPRTILDKIPSAVQRGIFVCLLAMADGNGQLTISVRGFADHIGASYQTLRTTLAKLIDNAIINATATQRLTQITICNFNNLAESVGNSQRKSSAGKNAIPTHASTASESQPHDGFMRFVEYFNRGFEGTAIPKITKLTDKRKTALRNIFKEYGRENVDAVLRKVCESDFLSGRETKWHASFDWIFTKSNFIKILEDNYANRIDQTQQQPSGRGQHRNPTALDLAREILENAAC